MTSGQKAARTKKLRAAGKKAAGTRKLRAAGRKAAVARRRSADAPSVVVEPMKYEDAMKVVEKTFVQLGSADDEKTHCLYVQGKNRKGERLNVELMLGRATPEYHIERMNRFFEVVATLLVETAARKMDP